MRIDTLHLQNFRCFEALTLDLHPRLTVLAGENGAGKTSVLEGLAIAAGAHLIGLAQAPQIEPECVRLQRIDHGDDHYTIEPRRPCRVHVSRGALRTLTTWERVLESGFTEEFISPREWNGDGLMGAGHLRSQVTADTADTPIDLPVIAGYRTDRLWRSGHDGDVGSRLDGYADAFTLRAHGQHFKAWMRRLEQAYLQRLDRAVASGKPFTLVERSPLLAAVQRCVSTLVPDAQRLAFDVAQDQLMLDFADGTRLPFEQLSDGYRNLVALAADIAWRAIQLNPHHKVDAITKAQGVVLIDEIELHLHPRWQRTVLPALMRIFPGLQFVVTTHLPVVLSSVDAAHLRFLTADGVVHQPGRGRGMTANAVLRELMGVRERDDATQAALDALAVLIEAGDAAAARIAYAALREQVGEDDAELRVLGWELDELETFGAID